MKYIRNMVIKKYGNLSGKEQTAFQEYYVLLVLKTLFPEEYDDLMKKKDDRPDLRSVGDDYGVEVTTADSNSDNIVNREFSKYITDKDVRRKRTIENNNGEIVETDKYISVNKQGGYNVDNDKKLLIKRIRDKVISANTYPRKYVRLELAIVKRELVPSVWVDNIYNFIYEATESIDCIFKKIYVLYQDKCYAYSLDGCQEIYTIGNKETIDLCAYLLAINDNRFIEK